MTHREPRTTAAMQQVGTQASPDNPQGTRAGLVLLYAPDWQHFRPAYLLSERQLTIGRDPQCEICVPEGAASRQHAQIRYGELGWMLSDLGSRNGTLIDGQFVSELCLEENHEIRVGDAIFKFVAVGAENYARHRIDGVVIEDAHHESMSAAGIVGGHQIRSLLRAVKRIAPSPISVVILGESGTGKELFAREVHLASQRRGAFQAVNCAAIPASLLESELFGYKRGAFSGAERDKPGLVRAADGGTLFLDEIGDMPLEAQAKLLRVLQSKEIIPVGATTPERVDVRIVCATHRDLSALQRDGKFRGDLFARLNEYVLRLAPLRERKEDLHALVQSFLMKHGRTGLKLTFPFMTGLLHYDWPFNVRELEASIKRAVALVDGDELLADHLPDVVREAMRDYARKSDEVDSVSARATSPSSSFDQTRSPADMRSFSQTGELSRDVPKPAARPVTPSEEELRRLLAQHRGNVAAVGREFGKERMQVHRWLKRYNIDLAAYR